MSKNQKSNSSFDSISIASPCSQDWNEMFGNDEVRFCHHCAKNVHNLSAITRKQAKKLVSQSKGNLCVQYMRRPDGRIQTADQKLYKIAGRASRLTTSVFGASLALTTAVSAQNAPSSEISATSIAVAQNEKSTIKNDGSAGAISGTVTDPNGAVVPGIDVTLINKSTNEERKTTTNEEGVYQFANVSFANYQIRFEGTTGFDTKTVEDINVNASAENKIDISLDVLGIGMGGAVVVISYQNPLTQAAYEEDLETVKQLIQNGVDINAKEKDAETTALHAAVETGNVEIVRELLYARAKPNARTGAKRTPLMQIDGDASTELVNLLLTYGARVNQRDEEDSTVLINAVDNSVSSEVLQLLIQAGADVDAQNKKGRTALMQAAYKEDLEAVKILLEAGANVVLKDSDNKTAFSLADSDKIRQLLSDHGAIKEVEPEN